MQSCNERRRRFRQRAGACVTIAAILAALASGATWGAEPPYVLEEDFSADPFAGGAWKLEALNSVSTQPASPPLMTWNPSSALNVTWDQNKPSSLYGIPLGRTVTEKDDFSFSFHLRLDSIVNPDGDFFEIAVGLDDSTATRTRVFDRSGQDFLDPADPRRSKNIVDWSWVPSFNQWGGGTASFVMSTVCPDPGDGPDQIRNHWGYVMTTTELQPGREYRIEQTYSAAARTFSLRMFDSGVEITTEDVTTSVGLLASDAFTVDRFAVKSYHNRYAFGDWTVTGQVDDIAVVIDGETVVAEDFSTDPSARWTYAGLRDYGLPQADLVSYDAPGKRLAFTWDAGRPSTAFSRALPSPLSDLDSFAFEFDLELQEIAVNGDFFEVGFGLHDSASHLFDRSGKNFADAQDPTRCKNIVDWNWVPPYDAWGGGTSSFLMPTIAADPGTGPDVILNHWGYVSGTTELTTGVLYHVRQDYNADTRELRLQMTADGSPIETEDVTYVIEIPETRHFRVDRFGPVSYFNSYAMMPGNWRVTGWLDNVRFERRRPQSEAKETWALFE